MSYSILSMLGEQDNKNWVSRFASKKDELMERDSPEVEEETDEVEDEEPTIDTSASTLRRFVDRLRQAPSGSTRVVLRMSAADLQDKYLKSKGAETLASSLSDDAVKAISRYTTQPNKTTRVSDIEVEVLPKGFSFSKMISGANSSHSNTVLLDVPTSVVTDLQAAGKSGDINSARNALLKAFSHRNYVMTLHNGPSKKIASKMDAAFGDLDELLDVISLKIVGAYPNRKELAEIKDEFAEYKASQQEPAQPTEEPESKAEETPKDKPEEAPAQDATSTETSSEPEETESTESKSDIESTLSTISKAWDSFVDAHGGMSKTNPERLTREYTKIPADQRMALQQQLLKMAKAVGFNEDSLR